MNRSNTWRTDRKIKILRSKSSSRL